MRIATKTAAALLLGGLALGGCSLDITNPNARPAEEVLGSAEGLISLAVGMQDVMASNIDDYVLTSALVTDEWGTGTASLQAYQRLMTGQLVDNTLGVVEAPWATTFRVVRAANELIANAPTATGLDDGTRTGILALAELYKGMALGMAIQQYARVPVDVSGDFPVPQPRAVVLDSVLALLESARARLATNPNLATFNGRVLGQGFDLRNTIDAMLARYYLMDGQYQQAIDAAGRVDPTVRSVWTYTSPDENPIKDLSIDAGYVFPLASFVSQADQDTTVSPTGTVTVIRDARATYWVNASTAPFVGNPDSLLLNLNQYTQRGDPFPVYLPDEMKLIQAEAYTRLGNYAAARTLINQVRTQNTAAAAPNANLLPLPVEALDTETELLTQIAYERRYELYMQGLRWEDTRRLDPYITTQPSIPFLPIPRQECITNPGACTTT